MKAGHSPFHLCTRPANTLDEAYISLVIIGFRKNMSPDFGTSVRHQKHSPLFSYPTPAWAFPPRKNLFALTSPDRGSSVGPFEPERSRAGVHPVLWGPSSRGRWEADTPAPPAWWPAWLSDSPGSSDSMQPSFTEHRVGGKQGPSPGSIFPPGPKS